MSRFTAAENPERPHLCLRCDRWTYDCSKAIDDVPYFRVLCAACLVKCPQAVADHYAPIKTVGTA